MGSFLSRNEEEMEALFHGDATMPADDDEPKEKKKARVKSPSEILLLVSVYCTFEITVHLKTAARPF
jgi:hypothetical protein